MIRRITLTNFMSHKDTVIEPADGLTILAGPNNCGKSAVVSALQILCGNARGDYMVRHGERECVVEVETDEGHIVQWRRKGRTVSYCLHGKDVNRLKNSIPDELHDLLRLPVVEADGDDFDIHFGEQNQPIILLNESPSRRATFFASSSDAVKLIEMQNVHRRKMQEANAQGHELSKREEQLKTRLGRLKTLEEIEPQLQQLESKYAALTSEEERRQRLWQLTQSLDKATSLVRRWTNETIKLAELERPPVVHDTARLRDAIRQSQRLNTQIESNRALQTAASSLAEPPAIADTDRLSRLINEITTGDSRIRQQSSRSRALATVECPPQLNNLTPVEDLIARLNVVSRRVVETAYEQTILSEVVQPPSLSNTNELRATIERTEKVHKSLTTTELEVQGSREMLAEAGHDLLHQAEELVTCPTCGQDFDPDKLVASAAIRAGQTK